MFWMWKNMLRFDIVETQASVWDKLKKVITGEQVAHAYLFQGPVGAGKEDTAYLFAASLNCLAPAGGVACGSCSSCQKVVHGNHPNIHVISPDGAFIKLQQMKELKKSIFLRQVDAGYQVVIVLQADKMTPETANSMLKILEEPPQRTVFILVANNNWALLPTVVSRCQKLSFKSLSIEERARVLAGEVSCDAAGAAVVLRLANGNETTAREMIEEGILELRDRVISQAAGIAKLNAADALFLAEEWAKNDPEIVLKILLLWYRDLEVWKKTGAESLIINQDKLDALKKAAEQIEEPQEIIDILLLAQQALVHNANKQLAMENMLLQWIKACG